MCSNFRNNLLFMIYRIMSSKNHQRFLYFCKKLFVFCKKNDQLLNFWNYFKKNWIPFELQITQYLRQNCFGINSTNNICEFKFKLLTKKIKESTKKKKRLDLLIQQIIEIIDCDIKRAKQSEFIPSYFKDLKKNLDNSKLYESKQLKSKTQLENILNQNQDSESTYVDKDNLSNYIKLINNLENSETTNTKDNEKENVLEKEFYMKNKEDNEIEKEFENNFKDDDNETEKDSNKEIEKEIDFENDFDKDEEKNIENEFNFSKYFIVARDFKPESDERNCVVYNIVNLQCLECSCKNYLLYARPCSHIFSALQEQLKKIIQLEGIEPIDLLNLCFFFNNYSNEVFSTEYKRIIQESSFFLIPSTNPNADLNKKINLGFLGNTYTRNNQKEFNLKKIIKSILKIKIENGMLFIYCDFDNTKYPAWVPFTDNKNIEKKKLIQSFLNKIKKDLNNHSFENEINKEICEVEVTIIGKIEEVHYYYNQNIKDDINSVKYGKNVYKPPLKTPLLHISKKKVKNFIKSVELLINKIN
jgi:hypothetical protein